MAAPIRVAVVNDYEIVVAGIAAMLAPHHDRIDVVELDSGLPVLTDVDVILYDTFAAVQGDGGDPEDLVRGSSARVVIFSWNLQEELIDKAIARGAAGYLSKGLPAEQVVSSIEAVHAGVAATHQVVEIDAVTLHRRERVVEDHVDVADHGQARVELHDADAVAVGRQHRRDAGDHDLVVVDDRNPNRS